MGGRCVSGSVEYARRLRVRERKTGEGSLAGDLGRGRRTVSGVSSGRTRVPSKRKRTVDICLPCRSQKASINFLSCVDRLILKKTSLLLSVTLMFKCSTGAGASPGMLSASAILREDEVDRECVDEGSADDDERRCQSCCHSEASWLSQT